MKLKSVEKKVKKTFIQQIPFNLQTSFNKKKIFIIIHF